MGTFGSSADFVRQPPRVSERTATVATPEFSNAGADTLYQQGQQMKEVAVAADHFGRVIDETVAQDALNQLRAKRQELSLDPEKGFARIKGGDVLKQGPSGKPWLQEFPDQLKQAADDLSGKLISPGARALFRAAAGQEQLAYKADVLRHVDTETKKYEDAVYKDTSTTILNQAAGVSDPDALDGLSTRAENAARNRARQLGIPDEALIAGAKSDVYKTGVQSAIARNDASTALSLYKKYEPSFDAKDRIALQSLLKTVETSAVAQSYVSSLAPLSDGADAMGVVRHFEGFIERPKRDTDGRLRVGYGSDTVTTADGKVLPVKADTVVTREDAERDLKRRLGQVQADIRGQIGDDAWGKLSAEARSSLSSIVYNYGNNWNALKPVLEAAKSGDKDAISAAIMGLSSHNGGINAGRRRQEAANVLNAKDALATAVNGQNPDQWKEQAGPPGFLDTRQQLIDAETWKMNALRQAQQDWPNDPNMLAAVKSQIDVQYEQKKQGINIAKMQLKKAVEDWVTKGGPSGGPATTRPPAQIWNQLDYETQRSVDATIAHNAKGTDAVTDQSTWYTVQRGLTSPDVNERLKWADFDLWKVKDKLSSSDFQELAKIQGTVRAGDPNRELTRLRTPTQMADDALRNMNIDPTPKQGSRDAEKAALFHRAVQDGITLLEQQKGSKATPEEIQKIIDGQVRKVAGTGSWISPDRPVFLLKIGDVPKAERAKIEDALKRAGIAATDETITDLYKRKLAGAPK